ncbi:MAG TPA: HNH endonuclease [Candidatus Limnocylindria bacterium]|nr:HNH endonuclease [Candidatus Limnocylindria bacterium]
MESKDERRRREARERTRRWTERHPESAERARERQRRWYEENKDEIRAKAREYMRKRYATDPQRVLATNKAWYGRNREQRREHVRIYRLANLEAIRAKDRERSRARYAADPAAWQKYLKEWRRGNPEKSHAYVRASNIKRRSAAGGQSFSSAEWLALLGRHQGSCAYCGSKTLIEIDHRIPLARGGSNLISNILPACRRCNRRKRTMTEEEFREFLQRERRHGLEVGLDGLDGNAGTTKS